MPPGYREVAREEALKGGYVVFSGANADLRNGAIQLGADRFGVPIAAAGAAPQPPARPMEYARMFVIDINKDGLNDVLTTMAHDYGVLWFEQRADGRWLRRQIDATWANAHSSTMADLNGDGQLDLVAAKRYFGRTGTDPSEREPMGVYWYQFQPGPKDSVTWVRHIIDYGAAPAAGCSCRWRTLTTTAIWMSLRPARPGCSCFRT